MKQTLKTLRCAGTAAVMAALLFGCEKKGNSLLQGYVEGEFVYVAAPLAGELETLSVQRGSQVAAGDPLFALECGYERALRDEAHQKLDQARANLQDAQRGQRPSEIQSLEAQLQQAHAALVLSEKELVRQEKLRATGAAAIQQVDQARSARDQDRERVSKLEADLETARLGSRPDQVAAAEANVRAQEAALAGAEWQLSQKKQTAPKAGLVFDTLYRAGDWVAAGRPVVSLLPPENIKVRTFVPETVVARIRSGEPIRVFVDGITEPFDGRVSFVSPQAEFTPPVIYSQGSREKLVFMIEATFSPESAARLHPGQPVDVAIDF
jgi:HlyD family secretion protein